jgi:drug/metabolite transporter superfamily protein YnfA
MFPEAGIRVRSPGSDPDVLVLEKQVTEKTTTGRLVAAGGGILLIVSLFLSWYGVNIGGVAGQYAALAADTSANGWQSLDIGDLVFLVVGLLAIAPAAFDIFDLEIELPFDIGLVALAGGAVSIAWIVLRIIDKPGPDIPDVAGVDVGIGLKFGIFVGLLGAVLIAVGGFLQQQEEDDEAAAFQPGAVPVPPQAPPVPGVPPAAPPAAGVPPAAPPAQAPPAQAPPAPGAPPAAPPPQAAPPAQAPPPPQPPAPGQQPPPPPPPAV